LKLHIFNIWREHSLYWNSSWWCAWYSGEDRNKNYLYAIVWFQGKAVNTLL